MNPIRIWQGTDKIVNVSHDFDDLPSAAEIEIYIDTPDQIIKTLLDGIDSVTASSYLLTVSAEDTNDVPSGEYKIQARITTASGSKLFGRIQPGTVKILDSVFTDTE